MIIKVWEEKLSQEMTASVITQIARFFVLLEIFFCSLVSTQRTLIIYDSSLAAVFVYICLYNEKSKEPKKVGNETKNCFSRNTLMGKLEWKSCSRFNKRPKRCFNKYFLDCSFLFTQPQKKKWTKENVIVPLNTEKTHAKMLRKSVWMSD